MTIRVARPDDVARAAAILEEAIAWASARGFSAWPAGSFKRRDGEGRLRLRAAQADGCLYLAWISGTPAATFTLLPADPRYWPNAPQDALYLHRFAVRRAYAGIGGAILDWIAATAASMRKTYLRLDCIADNRGIRAYYERAGFAWQGDVTVDGLVLSLYQLPVPRRISSDSIAQDSNANRWQAG